jgi:hypothetical protein
LNKDLISVSVNTVIPADGIPVLPVPDNAIPYRSYKCRNSMPVTGSKDNCFCFVYKMLTGVMVVKSKLESATSGPFHLLQFTARM